MTKSDLKNGMVCETRNGERFLWLNGGLTQGIYWCSGTQEDLTNNKSREHDIVRVYEMMETMHTLDDILKYPGKLIWERGNLER